MAAPLMFRGIPLLSAKLHHNKLAVTASSLARQPCSPATESPSPELSSKVQTQNTDLWTTNEESKKYNRCIGDQDYRNRMDKEEEILQDIDPIFFRTKFILHSDRYIDGERLTEEDEKAVIEKLLLYHPHSDSKIGSGLDHIMVDRHPLYTQSRCLFVVRIDGGWIDFSYQKCLQTYIQLKYPSQAKRFIGEYFKRASS